MRARRVRAARILATGAVAAAFLLAPQQQALAATVTVTRGVTVTHVTFTSTSHRTVRGVLMRVDLTVPGLHLDADSPAGRLGATRQPVTTIANARHALGGINADFFDVTTSASVFRGTMIRNNAPQKTPRPHWQANFYVTSSGQAAIGVIPFTGSVTRPATDTRAVASTKVYSMNTPSDAVAGRITYVTPVLLNPLALPLGCTTVLGTTVAGVRTVQGVLTGLRFLPRLGLGWWGLAGCGAGGAWLAGSLQPGDPVDVALDFPSGRPRAAVSGGRVLIQRGVAYTDPARPTVDLTTRNPETFACVSSDGHKIVLGALDGRSKASAGVTYGELTSYLIHLRCYSAMVFDGGGSTTIVAKLPGHTSTSVLNVPSDGRPRAVADGLFVYRS